MGSGIFSVAVSGLTAAQVGIQTTSHNIANSSMAGYSRQQIVQTTNTPMFTGAGFIGQGANVQTVQRVYSRYLTEQVLASQTNAAEMDSYLTQIEQIDNLLADPTAGLSPALAEFFKTVQELAANPASIPARQAVLSGSQALVARFQGIDQRIQEVRDGVNQQISSVISAINGMATQVSEINQRVILSQATGPGQPANDLLDERDELVKQLNQLIKVQAVPQGDGTYSIFIGNGQPLVVGTLVSELTAEQAPDDPQKTTIGMKTPFGGSFYLLESMLTGGQLGGLLAFRSQSLDPVQNGLGRVAVGLGHMFNQIHRSGQDLTGALGGDFFEVPSPVVNPSTQNASNSTTIDAKIINSDYRLVYSGGTFTVTRLSDGGSPLAAPAGLPLVLDGVTVSEVSAGSIGLTDGDVFVVRPGNPPGKRIIAEATNAGDAVLDSTGSNLQALTNSDFRLDYVATNQWRLTRLEDGVTWTSTVGADEQTALDDLLQYQPGFSMTLDGTLPTVGDSFVIQPTRAGASSIALAIADPRAIAAGVPFRTATGQSNSGEATISSGAIEYRDDTLPNIPLGVAPGGDIVLTFDATNNWFDVTVAGVATANPVKYDPSSSTHVDASINGLSFTISGRPSNGDTFRLTANANGVADNRTAQRLGALQTANLLNGSSANRTAGATATLQTAYSQIVSQVGNKAREVKVTGESQQILVDQASAARDRLSGVNLDEEAANLLKYQQAYQASAKILDVSTKLFEELLALGR